MNSEIPGLRGSVFELRASFFITMTLTEARKLLGEKHNQLGDSEVQKIIDDLRVVASCLVDRVYDSVTIDADACSNLS